MIIARLFSIYMVYKELKNGKIKLSIGGKPIGCIQLLDTDQPAGYILFFHVNERYQNQGYGSALLSYAIIKAKFAGCKAVSLYVDVKNLGAIRLYQREDFFIALTTTKKKRPSYYLMVKEIH